MRIVVTGATGNIGSALLRALEGRGHAVHGIARRPMAESGDVSWSSLDLSEDGCIAQLETVVAETDVVVNLAWAFQPMRRPDYLHRASVGILGRVARVVLARPGTRLVHLSSVAPALFPARVLRHVPFVPVDGRFGIQMVHADDVADVVVRVLEQRAAGAFNVASEPVLSAWDIAAALDARPVRVRQEATRAAAGAVWRAHLSPLDPGWVDMALQAPWVDSSRARDLLGWTPRHDAHDVLSEVVQGMAKGLVAAAAHCGRGRSGTGCSGRSSAAACRVGA
jgi:nucleoside-diphosphate-sugar epimerase